MPSKPPRLPPGVRVFRADESEPLLDDFTLRAARQRTREAPATPPVFPLPLRKHTLWSANNSLGFELDLDQDASSTSIFERTVLKLDEWGMPEVWSIALSTNFEPAQSNDDQAFFLEGVIEWGSGAAIDTVKVDWLNGTVLRLPMNAVNVKIRGLVGSPAGGTVPTDLRARVLLSRGEVPGSEPQRTIFASGVSGSVTPWTGAATIPKYAKRFIPIARNRASADVLFAAGNYFEFFTANASPVIASLRAPDALQYMGEGIPIPHGAKLAAYINGGAGTVDLAMAFKLAI